MIKFEFYNPQAISMLNSLLSVIWIITRSSKWHIPKNQLPGCFSQLIQVTSVPDMTSWKSNGTYNGFICQWERYLLQNRYFIMSQSHEIFLLRLRFSILLLVLFINFIKNNGTNYLLFNTKILLVFQMGLGNTINQTHRLIATLLAKLGV